MSVQHISLLFYGIKNHLCKHNFQFFIFNPTRYYNSFGCCFNAVMSKNRGISTVGADFDRKPETKKINENLH